MAHAKHYVHDADGLLKNFDSYDGAVAYAKSYRLDRLRANNYSAHCWVNCGGLEVWNSEYAEAN